MSEAAIQRQEEQVEIDLGRLDWYDAFFDRHSRDGRIGTARDLATATFVASSAVPGHLTGHPLSESSYWELFLSGYHRYRRIGRVARSEPYVTYLMGPFREGNYDPGLSLLLASEDATVDRVKRRYADMDRLAAAHRDAGTPIGIDPVRLVASAAPIDDDFSVALIGRPARLSVRSFDGYHRVFGARLLGFRSLSCRLHRLSDEPLRSANGSVA